MTKPATRLMLFLGSGISLPTGLPSTEEITRAALEEDWRSHSDGRFYRGPELNPALAEQNTVLRIQPFLMLLKQRADRYFQAKRLPVANYEDIYYLAKQLAEEAELSRLNPAIGPFFSDIKTQCESLCQPLPLTQEEFDFIRLSSEACTFIESVLQCVLWCKKEPKGLTLVVDLARNLAFQGLNIVTLNHDSLVEQVLEAAHVDFADGFLPPDGDLRFYDPSILDAPANTKLLKLHGSLSWRWVRVSEHGEFRDCYAKVAGGQPQFRKTASGIRIEHESPSELMVGTLNKLYDYHFGIISDLLVHFHRELAVTDTIIMSGYGWGDFAVNGWLKNWLLGSPNRRIVLLHQDPEGAVRDKAGSGIFPTDYHAWIKDKRLILIRKWLCDTSLREIEPFVSDHPA